MTLLPAHAEADRCPGALTLHEAADGLLARVRLPGGFVDPRVLRGLSALASRFGDGRLELTSRGNVQIRSIGATDSELLGHDLAELGLLPSPTHERVRNIVASPLAGLRDGGAGLASYVAALDRALCATTELQELSGRFLFAFDDGSGDVEPLRADVTARQSATGWSVYPGGFRVPGGDPAWLAGVMVGVAGAFLNVRHRLDSTAWRISDLANGAELVAEQFATAHPEASEASEALEALEAEASGAGVGRDLTGAAPVRFGGEALPPAGIIAQPAGLSAVVVVAPLGRLSASQADLLADLLVELTGDRPARITPWRSIVLPDVTEPGRVVQLIRGGGLDCGDESIWNNLTACAGRPGCAKSHADVQADAARAVAVRRRVPDVADIVGLPGLPVHWSGCSRRCGHPNTPFVDVLAGPGGYTVSESGPSALTTSEPLHQPDQRAQTG
ncbi:precorrin-3B synthase [Jatrophihabitans sp. GAS493]|uniref:precorrin-3B synthase n=1 Tax=Jatrophihabitans sp. GAS493 TaxID=1907575 RepID=UPI000BBF4569|nr:precorrin-3B synthase [Jatrophihabitans sp. GAS493]SOD74478.1 precorrin-3B synthase [Jatrophihabitans sp. GAS493]